MVVLHIGLRKSEKRKILVAFDGSEHSKRAVQYVIDSVGDSAKLVEVHVLNVQHESVLYGEYLTASMIDEFNGSGRFIVDGETIRLKSRMP